MNKQYPPLDISDTDYIPLITVQDLKNSIKENDESFVREKKILNLKNHIDEIIEEGQWDMDDVFRDTDFKDDRTFDCVVYYLAGYLARKLSKRNKCEICLSGIRNIDGKTCNLNEAQLIHLKSKGFLTYPDGNFLLPGIKILIRSSIS